MQGSCRPNQCLDAINFQILEFNVSKLTIITREDGKIEIHGPLFEESGWFIVCQRNGSFDLWEIPSYGGEPRFHRTFNTLYEAISAGEQMT